MSDTDDVIDPQAGSQAVTVGGETIKVAPLTIGQVPAFARAIRPAAGLFQVAGAGPDQRVDIDVLALVAEHGEAIMEAVAIALDREPEWVRGLDMASFAAVAETIIRVNWDFFSSRVMPVVSRATSQAPGPTAQTARHGAGRKSSKS